jgi:hypothetical protein
LSWIFYFEFLDLFGAWCLEFVWDLVLGAWNFSVAGTFSYLYRVNNIQTL